MATSNCGRPAPVSSTTLGGGSSQSHGGHGQCHGRAGGLLGHTHIPCTWPGLPLSPTHLIEACLLPALCRLLLPHNLSPYFPRCISPAHFLHFPLGWPFSFRLLTPLSGVGCCL